MKNIDSTLTPNNIEKVGGNKWDKQFDDYDNYVKEYLIHYKKSLKGNLVSLAIYPYMKVIPFHI